MVSLGRCAAFVFWGCIRTPHPQGGGGELWFFSSHQKLRVFFFQVRTTGNLLKPPPLKRHTKRFFCPLFPPQRKIIPPEKSGGKILAAAIFPPDRDRSQRPEERDEGGLCRRGVRRGLVRRGRGTPWPNRGPPAASSRTGSSRTRTGLTWRSSGNGSAFQEGTNTTRGCPSRRR